MALKGRLMLRHVSVHISLDLGIADSETRLTIDDAGPSGEEFLNRFGLLSCDSMMSVQGALQTSMI
jgi:hypothetical protein